MYQGGLRAVGRSWGWLHMLFVQVTDVANLAKFEVISLTVQTQLAAGLDKLFHLMSGQRLATAQLIEHIGDPCNLFQGFGAVEGVQRAIADG